MHSKNLIIGVLCTTAVILAVGLVVVSSHTRTAFAAAGPGVETGDFVLGNGQFLHTEEELFYVIDAVSQRMIVYRFDVQSRKSFSPTDGVDLAALRAKSAAGAQRPAAPSRRGGRGSRRP